MNVFLVATRWDFWEVKSLDYAGPGSPSNRVVASSVGRSLLGGGGLGSGTTASHFGNIYGRIRVEEMIAGRIPHALFLTTFCTSREGWTNDAGYIYPAGTNDLFCDAVPADGGVPLRDAGWLALPPGHNIAHPYDVPMGALFALDMSYQQVEDLRLQGLADWEITVLQAMREYGMYVGDTGVHENAIELESGMQYLACGFPDRWTAFGQDAGWDIWLVDDPASALPKQLHRYVGKLKNHAHHWAHRLKMVDPCVAQNNCAP